MNAAETANAQTAPDPVALRAMVKRLAHKRGWTFRLADGLDRGQGSVGLTLVVQIVTPDSYHPEENRVVAHYFPVPPAAYEPRTWRRWLLDQVLLVEQHEACEFFRFEYDVDDDLDRAGNYGYAHRPYAPNHGPGRDPYTITEVGTDEDARTSYLGVLKEAQ